MKKIILLLVFSVTFIHSQNLHLFEDFHTYFAKRDWKKMDALLSYDFRMIDYTGSTTHQKDAYMDFLKNWSGTMGTTWTVLTSSENEKIVYSTERDADIFLETFYGTAPTYSFKYEFKENQLYRLTYDTIPGHFQFTQTFDKNFNAFVVWVKDKHPSDAANLVSNDYKQRSKTYLKLLKLYAKEK